MAPGLGDGPPSPPSEAVPRRFRVVVVRTSSVWSRVGRGPRDGDMTADLTTASQRRWRATPATKGRRATWCRRYASRALRAAAVRAVGLKSAAGSFGSPREDREHFRGRAPDGDGAGLGAARRIRPSSISPLELRPAPDPRGHIYDPPARLQRGLSPPSGRSPTGCPESERIAHRARRRPSPRAHGRRLCTGDHWAATGPGIGARGAGPADLVSRCCRSFRPQKAARARAQHAELRDTNALGPPSRPATYVISGVQLRSSRKTTLGRRHSTPARGELDDRARFVACKGLLKKPLSAKSELALALPRARTRG